MHVWCGAITLQREMTSQGTLEVEVWLCSADCAWFVCPGGTVVPGTSPTASVLFIIVSEGCVHPGGTLVPGSPAPPRSIRT